MKHFSRENLLKVYLLLNAAPSASICHYPYAKYYAIGDQDYQDCYIADGLHDEEFQHKLTVILDQFRPNTNIGDTRSKIAILLARGKMYSINNGYFSYSLERLIL